MPAGELTAAYFDTSVLVKTYVQERGSAAAVEALGRYAMVTSAIAPIELTSALRRRRDSGDLAAGDMEPIRESIRRDRSAWRLLSVDDSVLDRAEDVAGRVAVRALDAVHLASALVFRDERRAAAPFITADERQRRAAAALGLDVLFVA